MLTTGYHEKKTIITKTKLVIPAHGCHLPPTGIHYLILIVAIAVDDICLIPKKNLQKIY